MKKKSLILSLFVFFALFLDGSIANAGYIHSIQIGGGNNIETFQYIGDDAISEYDNANDYYEEEEFYSQCLYGDKFKNDDKCKKLKKKLKAQNNNYTQPISPYYYNDFYYPYAYNDIYVSVDYLFYGQEYAYNDIYGNVTSNPNILSRDISHDNKHNYKKHIKKEEVKMHNNQDKKQNIQPNKLKEEKMPVYTNNENVNKLINNVSPLKLQKNPNEKKRPGIRY